MHGARYRTSKLCYQVPIFHCLHNCLHPCSVISAIKLLSAVCNQIIPAIYFFLYECKMNLDAHMKQENED
ncbi:unnamed protein product [Musa acuminata subsp. burmannicoides]